jgi:hypothetical protein
MIETILSGGANKRKNSKTLEARREISYLIQRSID